MESEEQRLEREAAEALATAEATAKAQEQAEQQATELKASLQKAFTQFIGAKLEASIIERMRQTAINIAGAGSNVEINGSEIIVLSSNGYRILIEVPRES